MAGRVGGEGEVALQLSHLAEWSVWLGITDDSHYSVWKLRDLLYYFHKWEKQDPQDESYDVGPSAVLHWLRMLHSEISSEELLMLSFLLT